METSTGDCTVMTRDGKVYNVDVLESGRIDLPASLAPDNVVEFYCDDCSSEVLDCRGYQHLQTIVASPFVSVDCSQCPRLTTVDLSVNVEELRLDDCVSLTELDLSDLDELQVLSCRGCTSLLRMVVPRNLQRLDCDDCQVLKRVVVHGHGRLREVHCTGCPPFIIAGETAKSIKFVRTD